LRGEVRAGRRSEPISEIEIEVAGVGPVEGVRYARGIAIETRATYCPKTKTERGYALGDEIALRPAMTAGEAFQIIGFSCLHHFAANRDAMAQSNPEGVRQKRVGLRRLRAAMSLSKELIEQPDAKMAHRTARTGAGP